MPDRPNLIIVPVGDASLHVAWCDVQDRNYDVWIIYYGRDEDVLKRYSQRCERTIQASGKKFHLIRSVALQFAKDISQYQYVWFPDDDIRMHNGPGDVCRMFDTAKDIGADLFQPAIANALEGQTDLVGKYCSPNWETCLYIPNAKYHAVTSVEMMMFGFSREGFERCFLPACVLARRSQTGWGVELIMTQLLFAWKGAIEGCYVLDCIPAIHTRPLGSDPEHNRQGHEDMRAWGVVIDGVPREVIDIEYLR